jgi:hypothetical protein
MAQNKAIILLPKLAVSPFQSVKIETVAKSEAPILVGASAFSLL